MYIFLIFKIAGFCLTIIIINALDGVLYINKIENGIENFSKSLAVYQYFTTFFTKSTIVNLCKLLALTFCK